MASFVAGLRRKQLRRDFISIGAQVPPEIEQRKQSQSNPRNIKMFSPKYTSRDPDKRRK